MKGKSLEVEQRYGKPLAVLLPEVINRHGSVTEAAKELGVSQPTVSLWLRIAGLKVRLMVVRAAPEALNAS
jgi:hypothetical protein